MCVASSNQRKRQGSQRRRKRQRSPSELGANPKRGFAPLPRAARLDAPELGPVRAALAAILRQQEPFPAVVMNRWEIVHMNQGGQRFFGMLLGDRAGRPAPNVMRLMFDPTEFRPHVTHWEARARCCSACSGRPPAA